MKWILGVSAFYHDAAACLLHDGVIVAAAQEERFTRKRHDPSFPAHAIHYCLSEAGITLGDVGAVVFYDKPLLTFDRLLETYLAFVPRGFPSFIRAMPVWLKEKLLLRKTLKQQFETAFLGVAAPPIRFSEHHLSHAASAFYPSPFEKAAVLCMDGVGEWATTSGWLGDGASLEPLWEIRFPHSLGLLYSAFTYYTGFKVNSGEYKVMGLAPYGKPTFLQKILDHLIDLKPDGTFRLNMEYFNYCTGLQMTSGHFDHLFGGPPRKPESPLTQREMDLAASIQAVAEEVVLRLAHRIHRETKLDTLCLAGGVALNCVANGRLLREGPFSKIWIQPAAGDAGGAIGCALAFWHQHLNKPRPTPVGDAMQGAYLGPAFRAEQIRSFLDGLGVPFLYFEKEAELLRVVVDELSAEKVVGWFQGRMEFGPRALGARSIIGDARSPKMQSVMNLKIKYRESFRPFAPVVTRENVAQYFELDADSPYMLMVAKVRKERRRETSGEENLRFGIDLLNVPRSDIPAVTHVDYSARIQTVHRETNPRFHGLLTEFELKTGSAVMVNSSFNVRGEPIVCTPEEAYRCFMRTEMDLLVLGDFVLKKSEQPLVPNDESWKTEFELD